MPKLNLTLPVGEIAITGKQVTFVSPCDSENLEGLVIDGVLFSIVDSLENPVPKGAFNKDSIVSVILHKEAQKAFIQNACTNAYLESQLKKKAPKNYILEGTIDQQRNITLTNFDWGEIYRAISGTENTYVAMRLTHGDYVYEYSLIRYDDDKEIAYFSNNFGEIQSDEDFTTWYISVDIEGVVTLLHTSRTEYWTFTLEDGSTVRKRVYVG